MVHLYDIGISSKLDWCRIRRLFAIGLFAAALTLAGDMLLGWGTEDETLSGLARMTYAYIGRSDRSLFAAALLGLIGIPVEGLCYFGIYRLMAAQSPAYAHRFRSGIFGYLIFGACGFHVPVCALVFFVKHLGWTKMVWDYVWYFILPAFVLFWIFSSCCRALRYRRS